MADFEFDPPTGLLDTSAYPDVPASPTAARQQFMDLFYQTRDVIRTNANQIGILSNFNKSTINVMYPPAPLAGAKGDGVTDDSSAFIAIRNYVESQIATDTLYGDGTNHGMIEVFVPAGIYLITQPEAMMRSAFTSKTAGIRFRGVGRELTQIIFNPSTTGQYLFHNNNTWLQLSFSDLTFWGQGTNSPSFMRSYSTGTTQNYTFERLNWRGTWNYGLLLEGTNTNSEMTFYHCGMSGDWGTFLMVPSATGSNQFLNYNFFAVNFEVNQGDFLCMNKGGNVNIWGGSYIHINSGGGTFFKLYNPSPTYGVQRFLCIGARFEHRFATSVLVDSTWAVGAISFINCDTASSTPLIPNTTVTAKFGMSGSTSMPVVKFDNCTLIGQHQYSYGSSGWQYHHAIVYENCEMTAFNQPNDFIVMVAEGGTSNIGSMPSIKFRNCRGQNDTQTSLWDSDLNFNKTMTGLTSKKIISLKNAQGSFPTHGAIIDVYLPINVVVTRVILFSPNGAVTSGWTNDFKVQTYETTPTILAQVTSGVYSGGFSVTQDNVFVCDSDVKRHIQLVAGTNIDQNNTKALCLIEYLG